MYAMVVGCYTNCVKLLFVACTVAGVAGDGSAQGTCANPNEVCTALGECLGTKYYSNHC